MKDELIGYDTAVCAKVAGFDELCTGYFIKGKEKNLYNETSGSLCKNSRLPHSCYAVPTQSLLQRWLREVHDFHVYAFKYQNTYSWKLDHSNSTVDFSRNETYETYEKALENGLLIAIKILNKYLSSPIEL